MTSPRDEIDNWLDRGVTPLNPPPGALDRIRRRARQRKTRQATFTAVGCAVVLAAAVVTPQVIAAAHQPGPHPPVAIQNTPPSVQPSPSHSYSSAPQTHRATQIKQHTTLANSWTVPPGNFQPTSVTFVGDGLGGVFGAVIGQAGTPGHCATTDCTSLAGTHDYGTSWYGVSAPLAPGPSGSAGVSQLRFANTSDGWAFGPAVWETTGGGWPWKHEQTPGHRVIDIEAVPAQQVNGVKLPARAFAVFGTCTGTGSNYAANCSSYSLWTSIAGNNSWTPVGVPAAYQQMASASSTAPILVISANAGYLLTPSGAVLTGPTTGAQWHVAGQAAPCAPGPAGNGSPTQQSGAQNSGSTSPATSQSPGTSGSGTSVGSQDTGAQFAAGPKLLLLACGSQAAGGRTQVSVHTSANGTSWQSAGGSLTVPGRPTALASAAASQVVLATTSGIEYSANGGGTWHAARFAGAGSGQTAPQGGFSYVGMTNATQGVAVPVNASLGEIYVTGNGGRTWRAARISS